MRLAVFLSGLLLLALLPAAFAQQQAPRLAYVYPAGGQLGTTVQVKVGGQYFGGITNAYVSGTGIKAELVEHIRLLSPKEVQELRDKLAELQKEKRTPELVAVIADIRQKLAAFANRPAPALAETAIVQVTLPANAEPGLRELRVGSFNGTSNPLVFMVGQTPEFTEKESVSIGDNRFGQPIRERGAKREKAEMQVALPVTVNGQILPGEVDRYRFAARKGERLVIATSARLLIPYLADAVPGWFQATLALYDADDKEVAYDDDFRFHPDPVLYCEIPKDGEYTLAIKDAIYRGREDFVYRVTVGELPFVTSVFPLGGRPGAATKVEIRGWNLPFTSQTLETKSNEPGTYPFFVRRGNYISNRHPFKLDTLPEILEQEPNNSPSKPQPIPLPIIINGRVDQPGDADVFRFDGRAGEQIVAEVFARRLDSPLDSLLRLTDAQGKQIALNDDQEDKGTGLNTHHADSYLRVTLPADGAYFLHLGDTQRKGSAAHAYRLRVSAPQPDFALRLVPSNLNARGSGSVPVTVFALRQDGFTNDITIALKDAPAGLKLTGGRIPAGQDQVKITLTVPARMGREPRNLSLEGRAEIGGQEVARAAVPAENMQQAFAYQHLVPAKEMLLTVVPRPPMRAPIRILSATPVKIPLGGTATVQVTAPTNTFAGKVHLELGEAPTGITIAEVRPLREGSEIVLRADATKAKPGQTGNLIVNAAIERAGGNDEKAAKGPRRAPMGALPAIPYEVTAPAAARQP